MIDFKKLQDGNDIKGIAIKTDGGPEPNLNKEVAGQIAGAFCYLLAKKVNKNPVMLNICVGQDPRISGDELKEGLLEAISLWGATGHDAGLAAAPAMFMSTVLPQFDFDGAIMITAGRLPYDRNGFRFFTARGGFEEEDISEMLRLASRYTFIGGVYDENKTGLMPFYAAYLRQMISQGLRDIPGCLKGMHILVDAGNGTAGFFATEVLERMGADVSGSRFLEPDGIFPNRAADPGDEAAMEPFCKAVADSGADLGIIFDNDGCGLAVVAPGGKPITRNGMIALAAALAAEDYPGGTVVTDSMASDGLHEFLEERLGLKHFRYKTDHRNVIRKAKELSASGVDAFLAVDTSGRAAYSDNFYLDDGIFLAVQVITNAVRLKAQGKDITALTDGLRHPAESRDLRFRINADDHVKYGAGVLEDFGKWAEYTKWLEPAESYFDEIRVSYDTDENKGWFLLRMPLNEPVMMLHAESDTPGGTGRIVDAVCEFMKDYREIETL